MENQKMFLKWMGYKILDQFDSKLEKGQTFFICNHYDENKTFLFTSKDIYSLSNEMFNDDEMFNAFMCWREPAESSSNNYLLNSLEEEEVIF